MVVHQRVVLGCACLAFLCLAEEPHIPLHKKDDQGSTELANHVVEKAPSGNIMAALKVFNIFNSRNRLGAHMGAYKGEMLEKAVRNGLPQSGPAVILETGCKGGDGSLFAAKAAYHRPGSTLISTEADENWLTAAKKIVAHATSNADFKYLPMLLKEDADFGSFLDDIKVTHKVEQFDIVLLDQDPAKLTEQVKLIIEKKMLRKGATVFVDNMLSKRESLKAFEEMVRASKLWEMERLEIKQPKDVVGIATYMGEAAEL